MSKMTEMDHLVPNKGFYSQAQAVVYRHPVGNTHLQYFTLSVGTEPIYLKVIATSHIRSRKFHQHKCLPAGFLKG